MKKIIFIFGALVLCLLILFKLSGYLVLSGTMQFEFAIAGIAMVFFAIGVYMNKKSLRKKGFQDQTPINEKMISEMGLSKREYEILLKISVGCSNKEIGEALFVSESTVKSHISNLFSKLNVKRRTQALHRAKELNII